MLPRRNNPWEEFPCKYQYSTDQLVSRVLYFMWRDSNKIFIIHCAWRARIIIVSHVSFIASTSKIKTLGLSLVGGTITNCLYSLYIYRGEKSDYSYILGSTLDAWLHELIAPPACSHKPVWNWDKWIKLAKSGSKKPTMRLQPKMHCCFNCGFLTQVWGWTLLWRMMLKVLCSSYSVKTKRPRHYAK